MAKVLQRLTGCVSTLGSSPMWARKVGAGTCKYVHDADAFDSLFVSFLFCALCRWQLLGLSSVHVPSVPHRVRRLVTAGFISFCHFTIKSNAVSRKNGKDTSRSAQLPCSRVCASIPTLQPTTCLQFIGISLHGEVVHVIWSARPAAEIAMKPQNNEEASSSSLCHITNNMRDKLRVGLR